MAKEVLFGRTMFEYVSRDSLRGLPLALAAAIFGGWLSAQTNLEPLLLLELDPASGMSEFWLLVLFPLGWVLTFAVSDVLTTVVFKKKGGETGLPSGSAFAFLPLLVVPGVSLLDGPSPLTLGAQGLPIILLQTVLLAWVVCLLSGAISVPKRLGLGRSLAVGIVAVCLNIVGVLIGLKLGVF